MKPTEYISELRRSVAVGDITENPAAQGAHDEARGKEQRRVELLHNRIAIGEECLGEIEGERGVGIKIVPLDQIAHRANENRLEPAPYVAQVNSGIRVAGQFVRCHGISSTPRPLSRIMEAGTRRDGLLAKLPGPQFC